MMAFQCRQAPVRIIHVGSVVAHNALRSERVKVLKEGQFSDMWGILQHIRRKMNDMSFMAGTYYP